MFGLSDNSDKNNQDLPAGLGDNTGAAMPAADNSGTGSTPDLSAVPMPAPAVTPPPPIMPGPAPSAPLLPADPPVDNSSAVSGGINDVSLENAYITADPLSAKNNPSQPIPTAASLLNNGSEDDLIKLKQQALQSLAPLVDHLDQSVEEKFKTTMMLIQASDNADLIPEAYEAANKITDEKVRAQALLDVVNEINYFTQHAANNTPQQPAE
jgi:hypothetical protein